MMTFMLLELFCLPISSPITEALVVSVVDFA
jgi:hypothetical protein